MPTVSRSTTTATVTSATNTATSGSFTPTAGDVLLALVTVGDNGGHLPTVSWNSGGAGTWQRLKSNAPDAFNPTVDAWFCVVGASPGASTVKAVHGGIAGTMLVLDTITSPDPFMLGSFSAPANGTLNSGTLSAPWATGGLGYFLGSCSNSGTALATPNAATTQLGQFVDPAGMAAFIGVATSNLTANTSVTPGCSTAAQGNTTVMVIEVVPLGAIVTFDTVTPVGGLSTTGTVTIPSYTPTQIAGLTVFVGVELRTANNGTDPTCTVSDGTNTYTALPGANAPYNVHGTNNGGGVFWFGHTYPSAPGTLSALAITVTAGTVTGSAVVVLAAANTSATAGSGSDGGNNAAAAVLDKSVTASAASSRWLAAIDRNGSTTAPTLTSNITLLLSSRAVSGTPNHGVSFALGNKPATGAAETVGSSTSSIGHFALLEVALASGGSAKTGDVALAEADAITAAGRLDAAGSAPVNEADTITAAGSAGYITGTTVSEADTISADGVRAASTGAAIAEQDTITATGMAAFAGAATVSEQDAVTADGVRATAGAASISEADAITAAGTATFNLGASIAEADTITAAGTVTPAGGNVTVSEVDTITADGVVAHSTGAAIAEADTIAAAGTAAFVGAATLNEADTITAAGTVTPAGVAATINENDTITADGVRAASTGVAAAWLATIQADGVRATTGAVSVAEADTITAVGLVAHSTGGTVTTTATVTASGVAGYITGTAVIEQDMILAAGRLAAIQGAAVAVTNSIVADGFVLSANTRKVTGQQSGHQPGDITGQTSPARRVTGGSL